MENLFSTATSLATDIMCKIIGSIPPENIPKLPYVSNNWYRTCDSSYFITDHSAKSKEKNYRHMLFCKLDPNDMALPVFMPLDPLINDEQARKTFSRIPSIFNHDVLNYVRTDKGVICFYTGGVDSMCYFFFWSPVTDQCVTVSFPNGITPTSFWFRVRPQYRSCSIMKISFNVCCEEWAFISIDNSLGIATWFNVSASHKTYVIWCSNKTKGDGIVWHQFRRIDLSPATLRFLDFACDFLICISGKMQYYDDEEQTMHKD
ncbi:uncharacterized protein G2W53_010165 [Senna tora]|uniref:Uncharacterized protein n=1 Tax=Senna tora TaxID=362788 RepID=A0A835CB19_9FABA|nr:uncharacterized protein G2W53_010165 [Senna tora]